MRSKLLMMSTAALLAGTLAAAGQSIQPGGAAPDKDKGQQGSSQGVKSNEVTRDQAPKGGAQGQVQREQDKQPKGQAQSDPDKQKSQTQGQAQHDQDKKGPTQGQAQSDQDKQKSQTKGQVQRDQDKSKGQTQGQAERDQDKQKSQTQGQAPRDQDRQQSQAPRDQDRQRQGQGQQGQGQRDQDRVQQGEREGQRSGNVSVSFTTEQRTKIRETVFKSSNAPRASNVNFTINVGTVVPRTVRIVDVPDVIVEVHPEWRGYRYFIVNDELVIVEPDTLRIVAVIDV
jgi:hypothetical protein